MQLDRTKNYVLLGENVSRKNCNQYITLMVIYIVYMLTEFGKEVEVCVEARLFIRDEPKRNYKVRT